MVFQFHQNNKKQIQQYLIKQCWGKYPILQVICQKNKMKMVGQLLWYLRFKILKFQNNGNIINLFAIDMVKLYKIYIKRTNKKFHIIGNILIKIKMKTLKQWYKQHKVLFQINNFIMIQYKVINMEILLQCYYRKMVSFHQDNGCITMILKILEEKL